MRAVLLCLLFLPAQLTWYELYERGEKYFGKGDYTHCIEDMQAALELKDTPGRNQFTRAVQKIDYKPFYYLALCYHRQDNLPEAYRYAQLAYQGAVVRELPILQSDLAVILTDYRNDISRHHDRYTAELSLIEKRTHLMTLLSEGRLDAVARELDDVDQPDRYNDIRMQLEASRGLATRADALYADLGDRIEKMIADGRAEPARAFYEDMRAELPESVRRRIDGLFAAVPRPEPEPEPPVETVPEPEAAPSAAETAAAEAARAELDRIRRRAQSLESETVGLRERLAEMTRSNKGLQRRLDDKPDVPDLLPQPAIVLEKGDGRIRVHAEAGPDRVVTRWQLSLNGTPVDTPPVAVDDEGRYSFETVVNAPYGRHMLTLDITDSLGLPGTVSQTIDLRRPWYRHPMLGYGLFAALAVGLLLRYLTAYRRRRHARLAHFNPYIAGSPVRALGMFYGRDALMHRIQGLVHKNSFMIHGARRIGKTSMLLQLKKNLAGLDAPDYKFYPAFIDLQGVREDDLFHHMMDELLSHRDDWHLPDMDLHFQEGTQDKYLARQFSKDLKHLIGRLQEGDSRHVQLVLLMDEVDVLNEFSEKTNQKLRGIFMKDFAEHLSCVMAGIHLKKEWDSAGSPWYNFFEQIPVDAFADKDARALVLDPVKGIFSYEKAAVDLIVKGTARHPYLIQKVCVSLIGEQLKEGNFRITAAHARRAMDRLNEEIQRNTHELHHQPMG